jgi:hypothetical protein
MASSGNCGTGNLSVGYKCKLSRVHEELDYSMYCVLKEGRVEPSTVHLKTTHVETLTARCLLDFYSYLLAPVGRTTLSLGGSQDSD